MWVTSGSELFCGSVGQMGQQVQLTFITEVHPCMYTSETHFKANLQAYFG